MSVLVRGREYASLRAAREAEERERREADVQAALSNPLYGRLTPTPGRLLTTRPHRRVAGFRTEGGIHMPEQAERHAAEWGFEVTVLAVGARCAPELHPGSRVLVPQFAGTPLLDIATHAALDLWIIGEGEVIAMLATETRRYRFTCGLCGDHVVERELPIIEGMLDMPNMVCAEHDVPMTRERLATTADDLAGAA